MKNICKFLLLSLPFLLFSCSEQEETDYLDGKSIPQVTTGNADGIWGAAAKLSATVANNGGAELRSVGICFSSTVAEPCIDSIYAKKLENKTYCSTGSFIDGGNNFSTTLLGLTANTKYYYRAFALNGKGVAYGEIKSFNSGDIPLIDATFTSTLHGTYDVEIQAIPAIGYYNVLKWFDDNYDVAIWIESGNIATVATQNAFGHPQGTAQVNGSGILEGKTFKLKLTYQIPGVGGWGEHNETLVMK